MTDSEGSTFTSWLKLRCRTFLSRNFRTGGHPAITAAEPHFYTILHDPSTAPRRCKRRHGTCLAVIHDSPRSRPLEVYTVYRPIHWAKECLTIPDDPPNTQRNLPSSQSRPSRSAVESPHEYRSPLRYCASPQLMNDSSTRFLIYLQASP